MRVLLATSDPGLRSAVGDPLRHDRIDLVPAASSREAFDQALLASWGAIVIDQNLHEESGVGLCARMREAGVQAPVILLLGRSDVDDCIAALEAGADDCVHVPFAPRELSARLWALARRPPVIADTTYHVDDLEVNIRTRAVRRSGRALRLTAKEFALLELFVRNAGTVLDRGRITAHVWDDNHDPDANALGVLVRRLRTKLDDAHNPRLITTVRGAGYRFGP